jgi:hypothetical protein
VWAEVANNMPPPPPPFPLSIGRKKQKPRKKSQVFSFLDIFTTFIAIFYNRTTSCIAASTNKKGSAKLIISHILKNMIRICISIWQSMAHGTPAKKQF